MADTVDESESWDRELPTRIYATDRYPDGRLNVYSKIEILIFVRKSLEDTDQWDALMDSCFAPLFSIPVSSCPFSGKLIHALLCRQLDTKKKYELWTVFGGQPLRFSLAEFCSVTGLPYADFPPNYDPDVEAEVDSNKKTYWDVLIARDPQTTTLEHVKEMLTKSLQEEGPRKLRLALLLIVDGVLMAQHQSPRPTLKYVLMLEDLHAFLSFPWGRESFFKTITGMLPCKKLSVKPVTPAERVNKFRSQLQQKTMKLQGFPLALQLLALKNISGLAEVITDQTDTTSFLKWEDESIPRQLITLKEIQAVEQKDDLCVIPWIIADGDWDDEIRDKKVLYMVEKIARGYIFKRSEWPGGDKSFEPIKIIAPKVASCAKLGRLRKRGPASKPDNVNSKRRKLLSENHENGSDVSDVVLERIDALEMENDRLRADIDKLSRQMVTIGKALRATKKQKTGRKSSKSAVRLSQSKTTGRKKGRSKRTTPHSKDIEPEKSPSPDNVFNPQIEMSRGDEDKDKTEETSRTEDKVSYKGTGGSEKRGDSEMAGGDQEKNETEGTGGSEKMGDSEMGGGNQEKNETEGAPHFTAETVSESIVTGRWRGS